MASSFSTDSGDALDKLRQQAQPPVSADSSSSVDESTVDLLSQFHEDSKAEEDKSKADANTNLDAFKQGKGDQQKLEESLQKHRRAKFRNQFISDYMASQDSRPESEQPAPGSESN